MRADLLLQLADFLETAVPPERFDMSNWGQQCHDGDTPACRTEGCAFGWATVLWPDQLRFAPATPFVRRAGTPDVPLHAGNFSQWADAEYAEAAAFFDITQFDAVKLFQCYDEDRRTPAEVAGQIRRFVSQHELAS